MILVRHGVTEWNCFSRYQGQIDVPLSVEGLKQSRALARAMETLPLAAVYTSPLSRARVCAELVAEQHGLQAIPIAGLTEICHGDWEGMLLSDVEKSYADLLYQWRTFPYTVRMPRGESLAEVEERAWSTLEEITKIHPCGIVLAVTHDTPIRTVLRRILNLGQTHFWQIKLDNTGINVLGYRNGSWRVMMLNDTCHLGGWMKAGEQLAL